MAEDIDRAGERIDAEMRARLRVLPVFDIPSLSECMQCGGDIPAIRQAMGNVKRCIDCQSHYESALRTWNHGHK